jgi:PAS domain S-box-containing protein
LKAVIWMVLIAIGVNAAEGEIRFGVFNYKGYEETAKQYAPLVGYLNSRLEKKVVLEVLNQEEMEKKIERKELDIATTNPTHFLVVRQMYRLSGAVATLMTTTDGHPLSNLGGVIVVRSDSPIYSLEDIVGKTILTPSMKHMGGFRAQAYELHKAGIDVFKESTQIVELKVHQDVIKALIAKKGEVGFVRDGTIEGMIRKGELDPHHIRVINQKLVKGHPLMVSTDLYPEWPVFAAPNADPRDVKLFVSALYALKPTDLSAEHPEIYGYTLPADYLEVEELARTLRLPPFDQYLEISLNAIWDTYRYALGGIALSLLLALSYYIRSVQRRKLFESLVSNMGDGVYGVDSDGKCIFINYKALELVGYSEHEVLGHNTHRLFHYERPFHKQYEWSECPVLKTLNDRKTRSVEEYFITKSGELFPTSLTVAPMDNGGAIVVFRDVSEQRSLYKTLQSERDLFSEGPVFTIKWIPTEHWPIEYVSRNVETILGYTSDEMTQEEFIYSEIIHPDDLERISTEVSENINNNKIAFEQSYRLRCKDGEYRWFYDFTRLKWDEFGKLVSIYGYMFDQTQLKQIQEEMKIAKEEAEDASRAKGNFLANMSHEIRTPMNAIIGLSQLLLDGGIEPRYYDTIQKIHGSSRMLLGIINDILDYSKIEAGKMELETKSFELEDIFSQLRVIFIQSAYKKELELYFRMGSDVPRIVIGDELRLDQVLTNLLSNALKFTSKGNVTLSIDVKERRDDSAVICFSVSDTGIGMSSEQLDKIFSPFTQADSSTTRKYGGTGLGLAISKRLVEAMGGELSVQSSPNEGTEFSFEIEMNVLSWEKNHSPIGVKPYHVLIVDDQKISRDILRGMVERFGCSAVESSNGESAIIKVLEADRDGKQFDFILMDWIMPGMDGKTAIREIKRMAEEGILRHNIPSILMVSAHVDSHQQENDLGIDRYLSKPVTSSTLFDALCQNKNGIIRSHTTVIPDLDGIRILLAEDNEINQDVAMMMLSRAGIEADVASNGQIAVERYFQSPERYALILMDLQMPVMSGYEATMEIRKRDTSIPIIALTAAAMIEDRQKVMEAGMNDHLSKPIEMEELYRVISKWTKPLSMSTNEEANLIDKKRVFDEEYLMEVVGKNHQSFEILIRKMARSLDREFADIIDHIRNGSADAPTQIHALKGVSGNIGAHEVCEISTRINRLYQEGEIPSEKEISELFDAIKSLREVLEIRLSRESIPKKGAVDSSVELAPLFESLRSALMRGDVVDDLQVADVAVLLEGKVDENELKEWLDAIEEFEYDKAFDVMKRWNVE